MLRKKQDSLVNLVQPINGVILALWGFIRKGIFGFFSLYDSVFGSRMRSRRDDVGIVPYGGLGAGAENEKNGLRGRWEAPADSPFFAAFTAAYCVSYLAGCAARKGVTRRRWCLHSRRILHRFG